MFSGFKLPLGLVLVLFLSTQAVLRSLAASSAPLTRMSIPKDIGLILGKGTCPHNPQLISSHNLEKRHFGERQWHSPVCEPEQERSKWAPYQSERRKLGSCCGCLLPGKLIHFCSPLPPWASPGVGTMQGQRRSLGVPSRLQGHRGMAVTAPAVQRAELGTVRGPAQRAEAALSYNTSSSWGLGRKSTELIPLREYTEFYTILHVTHAVDPPPQAARGQAWKAQEPPGGCSHFL